MIRLPLAIAGTLRLAQGHTRRPAAACLTAVALLLLPPAFVPAGVAFAAGSRIEQGLNQLESEVDVPTGNVNFREALSKAVIFVVNFLALAAVITIIAAGFFLILGFGTEASAQRAKKIIMYTIIGILVIFFVRVIVGFFTGELPALFP